MTHQVCIVGSGNFGSTIAKVIGNNILKYPDFNPEVKVYVYDEIVEVDGQERSIVEVFNEKHENVKYLPGIALPENVVAYADLIEACRNADFLVFVTPHQFLTKQLDVIKGEIENGTFVLKPNTTGLSLVKGVTMKGEDIFLVTDLVTEKLGIPCGGLMGANIANDIAREEFCESTIAFEDPDYGNLWKPIIENSYFRIKVIGDLCLQQLCGTLKNVVALGAGFIDGLELGQNTKAAIIRIGLEEIFEFANWYYPERKPQLQTMMESCGVADTIATAYGGRNRKCAEEFARTEDDITLIEERLLNGQKLQGNIAAKEVFELLQLKGAVEKFPVMVTIYMIITKQIPPRKILEYDGPHILQAKLV